MSVAELPIEIDREKIAEFCRACGIRKLSLFGSVLRDDFDPARSDVDVLAEFEPDALKGVGFRYFGYGEELSAGKRFRFMSVHDPQATLRQIQDAVQKDVPVLLATSEQMLKDLENPPSK
jgi:predicted nucleotidyltransferase